MNANDWAQILDLVSKLFVFPLATTLWSIHGRLSVIEGRLSVRSTNEG